MARGTRLGQARGVGEAVGPGARRIWRRGAGEGGAGALGASAERGDRKAGFLAGMLAPLAGAGAAILASLCCLGPLLFVTLGVGAGLASTFEPLRPVFTVLTVGFLAVGFYVVYGSRSGVVEGTGACVSGGACGVPESGRRGKLVLWIATVLALVAWTVPYWSRLFV